VKGGLDEHPPEAERNLKLRSSLHIYMNTIGNNENG
jgi:hypothetical protein